VNGQPVNAPGKIQEQEKAAPGVPLLLHGVHADGKPFSYVVTPVCDSTGTSCFIGISVQGLLSPQTAVTNGVSFPFLAIGGIAQGLDALITGQIPGGLFGSQGLAGPIGIAAITDQAVGRGPGDYVLLVAFLSVALGFTNLLPIPALDAGRTDVFALEGLCRRRFDRRSELNFERCVLAALLGLAALISFLDIQ